MRLIHIIATVIASISMLVNCMTANATNSVKTRLQNRYVLAGHVDDVHNHGHFLTICRGFFHACVRI